jgi:hypothetical protein
MFSDPCGIIWGKIGSATCVVVGGLLALRMLYLISEKHFYLVVGAGLALAGCWWWGQPHS